MVEWTKDFIQNQKKNISSSFSLLQIESVHEEPQVVRTEQKGGEISLVSESITQDTEMSEPPISQSNIPVNQEDLFVWIRNLDSQMKNRE
jgi:hypothetical protein